MLRNVMVRRGWLAMVLLMLLPLAAGGASSDAQAQPASEQTASDQASSGQTSDAAPSPAAFEWENEQFYYSLRVNGAEALRATLKAGDVRRAKRGSYVPVALNVRSLGFFHNIYPVNDRADTFLNPRTFRPYRSEKVFQENGKKRTYEVDFNHAGYRAAVQKTKPSYVRKFKKPIPGDTHDMITWMYELRTREIGVGKSFQFYVYDGWYISDIRLKVVGKEDLYTPAGWFKTWKFEFVRKIVQPNGHKGDGDKKDGPVAPVMKVTTPSKHAGHFWLSRDENHLPLRVTINTGWGYGEAVLIKYDRHNDQP